MPLDTAPAFSDPYTQADLPATASAVRSATFDQALNDLPGASVVHAIDLDLVRHIPGAEKYSPGEADYFMEEQGLKGQFKFDRTYNELELREMARRKREEIARSEVLARAEGSGSTAAGRFGINLATQLLDPLSVGASFVPVVGEERYAAMIARASGAFGRASVRAGVGAAEGAAGSLLLEPLVAGAKIQDQEDYRFADSFMNVALGTVFGGGLHVAGGTIRDRFKLPSRALPEDAARIVPADINPERAPADVGPLSGPLNFPDEYHASAAQLRSAMFRARDVDLSDPAAVSQIAGRKAQSLSQFIREKGGIIDDGGELSARDVTSKTSPGLIRKKGTAGADMDAVREKVFEAGYFPGARTYNDISDSQLFDALASDVNGDRTYPADFSDVVAKIHDERDFIERLESQGITRDMDVTQIANRLRDLDDEARGFAPTEREEGFDEYEQLKAHEVVDNSELPQREAALRTLVGQAVTGKPLEARPIFDRSAMVDAARRIGDPDQALLADPVAVNRANEILSGPDPTDAAKAREDVAALETRLMATLDEHALDAPNFGLEEWPRTIPDDDPLLVSRDTDTSPERVAMREKIVADQLKDAETVTGRKPIAFLMGGGGASGKGTILKFLTKAGEVPHHGAVHVDPDELKKLIPEFDKIAGRGDSRAAAVVHEESSALAKAVIAGAVEKRADMVLDRTLASPSKGLAEIAALKAAGYEVRLYGVTVEPRNAVKRADTRARGSGRYVPVKALLTAHKGFATGFEELAGAVDKAILFDNEVPKNAPPRVLATKDGGELKVSDKRGYNAFRERASINENAATAREIGPVSSAVDRGNGARGDAGDVGANARGDGRQGQRPGDAAEPGGIPPERLAELPDDVRAELEAADQAAQQLPQLTEAARMLAACATRSAA